MIKGLLICEFIPIFFVAESIKPGKLAVPPDITKGVERVGSKERIKELRSYDETRLFYVAVSRARSNIIFTASPEESAVSSSFLHRLGIKPETYDLKEENILVNFLEKTNLMEPFIGTEDVLGDLVKDMTLNPTSLDNYLRCRRKFLYDNVLMLPSAKKQSLIFGNAVHSGLEHLYREYIRTNRFPDFQFFKNKMLQEYTLDTGRDIKVNPAPLNKGLCRKHSPHAGQSSSTASTPLCGEGRRDKTWNLKNA